MLEERVRILEARVKQLEGSIDTPADSSQTTCHMQNPVSYLAEDSPAPSASEKPPGVVSNSSLNSTNVSGYSSDATATSHLDQHPGIDQPSNTHAVDLSSPFCWDHWLMGPTFNDTSAPGIFANDELSVPQPTGTGMTVHQQVTTWDSCNAPCNGYDGIDN